MNINLGLTAVAGGTVDVITATYAPVPSLVDKLLLIFRASGANTSTAPTFNPNALGAKTIVKKGGGALVAGDIPGAGAMMIVQYNLANTRWELLNPAIVFGTASETSCQGNDARLSDTRNRKIFAYDNTTKTHVGNVLETILLELPIPANTLGANDILWTEMQIASFGLVGTKTFRVYIGPTSGTTVGATQIGLNQLSATQLTGAIERRVVNKNSQSSNEVWPATQSGSTDLTSSVNPMTTTNLDFATQLYFYVTVQNLSALDTAYLRNCQLYINKA